jgi:hypothetical protein
MRAAAFRQAPSLVSPLAVGIAAARNIGCRHSLELSPPLASADDEIE